MEVIRKPWLLSSDQHDGRLQGECASLRLTLRLSGSFRYLTERCRPTIHHSVERRTVGVVLGASIGFERLP